LHRNWVVGLSVISLCELQFGIDLQAVRHPHLRARQQQLLATAIAPFQLFPVTEEVVQSYGRLRTHLQVSGNTIGALDTLIAAQALSLNATMVTSNLQEFRRVPNLHVEDWR
jgi:tRNA(fMet)-specific endonuclease VapC